MTLFARNSCMILLVIVLTGILAGSWANGQPPRGLTVKNARKFADLIERDWKQRPEWADMLLLILDGKPMKANAGWFKPSEIRLGWKWLAEHFDTNRDQKITRDEGRAFAKVFSAIDRDGNGWITAIDFDWKDISHVGPSKPSEAIFFMLDRDSNGRVDQREIMQMMAALDRDQKGFLTPDEFSKGFEAIDNPPKPDKTPPKSNDEDPNRMLNMLFQGELGSLTTGPALGELAPDFNLPRLKGSGEVNLSSFRGQKIVVLNFGSFT